MGQIASCDNVQQNMDFLQDEFGRHARIITEIATLTHKELTSYIEEINELSKSCMDSDGKQLVFMIKKGSDDGLLWKNSVRIGCIKYDPETRKIVKMKAMTLNQFLRVFRALKMQFEAAEHLKTEQGEEAAGGGTDLINTSLLMKDFDVVAAATSECCICFERPHEILLPCLHSFCQVCIVNWNSNHQTCPICRETIGSGDESWVIFDVPSGFQIEEELVSSVMDIIKTETDCEST